MSSQAPVDCGFHVIWDGYLIRKQSCKTTKEYSRRAEQQLDQGLIMIQLGLANPGLRRSDSGQGKSCFYEV
jgi:hypothetical protein